MDRWPLSGATLAQQYLAFGQLQAAACVCPAAELWLPFPAKAARTEWSSNPGKALTFLLRRPPPSLLNSLYLSLRHQDLCWASTGNSISFWVQQHHRCQSVPRDHELI
ncbi:hypothetical protein WJX84_002016 [Apatococcus fuscideae]|uniref:Uncharacterized protein n=1 Tax=Apatococcus fuscideae TaxID=2026836 RepID=A0AAW1STF0_9CHLO